MKVHLDIIEEVSNDLSLSKEVVNEMITLAFRGIKDDMTNLTKPVDFMLPHLGKFKLYPGRMKAKLNMINDMLKKGSISEEEHKHWLNFIKTFENEYSKKLEKPDKRRKKVN